MYGNQQPRPRPPRNPCTGRVWPAKQRSGPKAPAFTGEIALPDGHVMRVAMWESFGNRGAGPFNGFSIKISEDTRQGDPYHAQAGYGQAGSYGQPQNGYQAPQSGYAATQSGYGAPQQGYGAPPPQQGYNGPPTPPVESYRPEDQGYVPGFDD